jgi:hypothetical protein
MNASARRLWFWPCVIAAFFLLIPLLLLHHYPISFWASTDYQTLGLADAMNMAYRIADREMYFARGMTNHPGVPFYFMNWLALALTGFPVASADAGFLDRVIERIEDYHRITIWLAALTGGAGVYVFARAARSVAPLGVVAVGLLAWLVSTPATLLTIMSPSIDSFAILINGLFLAVLLRIAYDEEILRRGAVLGACAAAFAYLSKLSYLYVPLAFLVTGVSNLSLRKVDRTRRKQLGLLTGGAFVLIVVAVGVLVIGLSAFRIMLGFHRSVFVSSGLYGTGDKVVVGGHELWHAATAIPLDRAYAVPIALILGCGLVVGGFVSSRRGPEHIPVTLISIGAGVASLVSAIFVMKHYAVHYTAGVSATFPASVVACYLLVTSWGWGHRLRAGASALAAIAILVMAYQVWGSVAEALTERADTSRQANADMVEIKALLASGKRPIEFGYRAPFSWSGEGFVIYYASIPRLADDYVRSRKDMFSSGASNLVNQTASAYVLSKAYFRTAADIKASPNVIPDHAEPVTFKDGDKIIELRTVFLLIRAETSPAA